MEVKKIYFDMDGVLADFGRGVEELCGLPRDCDDNLMWEAIKKWTTTMISWNGYLLAKR